MDGNNWRPTQGEPSMDGGDWRTQLMPDSRQRIVNKIMETLKRHLPIPGPEGLVELRKIAVRFEEKIYTAATSQSDYLRKISLKMLTMETKSQGGVNNSLSSNPVGNQNPLDAAAGLQGLQPQVRNPGQSLQIPLGNQSQQRQQLLPQTIHNAIASAAAQSSPGLQSALSSMSGLTQNAMSNVVGQNSNLQTMSGISQNSVNNSMGQGVQSNILSNSQRQMQGRQHPQQVLSQQHQQSQNSQQLYPQQMMKQKLQQGNIQPSLLQSHMQQQQPSLLQSNQMQPSQQSLMQMSSQSNQATFQQMQPSMMQSTSQTGLQQNHLQQNQQSSVQQSGQSGLQQHPQSVLRQHQSQQSSVHQQTPVLHQQQTQINQQPMLLSQQQQLMSQQPSATNMQQNQLLAQQNSVPDIQQQQQHQQQMLLGQQNNFSNMQQQQLFNQQNKNLHQLLQLGLRSNVSGILQQQQLIGSQPGPVVSNMQLHQQSVNLLQQTKVLAQQQQQLQQTSTLLPSQGQQSQSQPPPHQLMSQSQPAQLQQHLGLQQQPNTLQREMQQRIQLSSALLQSQNAIEQQEQQFLSQRAHPEASSTSMDSTPQRGHVGLTDWQVEVYRKLLQLGLRSNVSGIQQQQQLIGSQPGPGVSNVQLHQHSVNLLQQTKVAAQQQQQPQQTSTLFPSQGQQSQSQPPPHQLMSQSRPVQLQQHLGLQQQPNTLQQEMQQRIQLSSALLQSQNAIEQQKQQFLSQRAHPEASSTSMDSTPQTGHVGVTDWQEEVYQKIKSMKEMYLPELNELYQKIAIECQQNEVLGTQSKQSDPMDKLKFFKSMLERMITFLQVPKNNISPTYKEKLAQYEKQIIGVLNSNRSKKPATSQQPGQQQLEQSVGQSHSMTQQPQSQISQLQQHDNLVNSMPMNMQGSVTSMQSTAVSNLPHGSIALSTHMGGPATQQNMMNALQSNSNLESGAGHAMNSLPQGVVGSLQQNPINASQQNNIGTLSQNNMNQLLPNVSSLQSNSNILQPQHLKQQQEQQLMQSQQLKQQYQHRLMLQQYLQQQQKQQMLQQQQQQQMSEANDLKVRPGAGFKPGLFPQTHTPGQRPTPYPQQLKTGAHFPIASPQLLQASSPQVSQHSSPWIDQQNLLSAFPKTGTPLQSANSPFIGTSPSTPAAPSLISGDSEKQPPAIPSVSSAGNIPLLAEFTGLGGTSLLPLAEWINAFICCFSTD